MVKAAKAGSGNQRWRCRECKTRTTNTVSPTESASPGYEVVAATKYGKSIAAALRSKKIKRVVVTCAQNNTKVDDKFLLSLAQYCFENEAALAVIPVSYKNISLYRGSEPYEKWYDPAIVPFLVDGDINVGGNVVIRADVALSVTTLNPLTGKEPINGTSWTIFGHPQFAMEPVASPGHLLPKRMYTTGAVTKRNYSKSNLGARAEFHHVMGALVVEPMGRKHAFIRHLNAGSTGSFYDLDKLYAGGEVTSGHRVDVLATGDEHVKFMDKKVYKATYGAKDSIVSLLRPRYIAHNDILDGYAGSHHHEKDDVTLFRKHHFGDNDYRKELDQVVDFLNNNTPPDCMNLIVPSNHHDHLYKWLASVDPRKDHTNAELIHELKAAQYANAKAGKTVDPLEIYLSARLAVPVTFLDRSDPFLLNGVNYSQHGDVGANGSRGNARALAKSTYKMVIGHSHGARIVRGVYQVGTSTGQLEYEKGLSDHTNTHCVQYPNGKRALIDIINGKWRL